jgi:hypothetical protein
MLLPPEMFFLSFPARTAPPSRILVLPETFVGMKRAGGQGSQFLPSRARCRRVCSVSAISATPSPVLPSSTREANGGAPTGNGAGVPAVRRAPRRPGGSSRYYPSRCSCSPSSYVSISKVCAHFSRFLNTKMQLG